MEPFIQTKSNTAKEPSLFLLSQWMQGNHSLSAGFSGREGGVSVAPWTSLNIGLHVGDSVSDVIDNRKRLTTAIGWPFEAWTCAEQVHSNRVSIVTEKERGKGRMAMADTIGDCDAIMTNVPGVLLASFYADCVPLYFYAEEAGAIALAHAGWRGTVENIAKETILAMGYEYGVKPENIKAAIGPSIGSCCYEVDGVVIQEVERVMNELQLNETIMQNCIASSQNGKAYLNLKEINRQIMIKAGILPIHIELTKWCTGCRTDLFYSHRMEGGSTGRMASWIGIRGR
ncbi:peptidoglycan editing factor PgeF [Paenibacillus sp. GSMTC-2017]|uniref:peptidoglycan editing factor PgeF n=1 Tax=Paenibacillus sp. GSMTC-2017 TaxID=2794350 RepID=UPI0018D67238|nr:peptidoglycan editing factor PgeF [Paenibacillus sp. GSMTC-2017]MBH5316890.1 peptidoglycan editing factor PgeF [Paenibacillus sp. GSMTC-2017]